MAKNTKAQEVATGTSDSYTVAEATEALEGFVHSAPVGIRRAVSEDPDGELEMSSVEGGTEWLPEDGTDSSASFEKALTANVNSNLPDPNPAPTTENPSSPEEAQTSGADSADGSTPETDQASPKKAARKTTKAKAADDFSEF